MDDFAKGIPEEVIVIEAMDFPDDDELRRMAMLKPKPPEGNFKQPGKRRMPRPR